MNKDSVINLRISTDLKEAFQTVVSREGYSMSEVVEACMQEIARRGYIPINIRSKLRPRYENILSIPFIKKCLEQTLMSNEGKKVKTASLFRSYSKGEATSSSDVDLFIETDDSFSLFDLTALQNSLESALGKSVDLVTSGSEDFLNHIQKEKIQLYERQD